MILRVALLLSALLATAWLWQVAADAQEPGDPGPALRQGAGTGGADVADLRVAAGTGGRERLSGLVSGLGGAQADEDPQAAQLPAGDGTWSGRESARPRRPRPRVHPQILRKLGIDADGHEARFIEDWIGRLRRSQRRMLGEGLQRDPAQRQEFNRQAKEFRSELIGFLGPQRAAQIAPELPLFGVDEKTGRVRRTDLQGRPRKQAEAVDNCDA